MPKSPQSHLDPRQPLVVDTTKLPRQPGATRALKRVVPAPADLGLELISVPSGSDLELDLSMTSVSEGVYVSGTVRGSLQGECGRCLNEIDSTFEVSLAEMFAYEDSTTEETTDEDEVGRMQGDLLDLEPAVRDAVVLTLPTNPVCRPDCPGLCPDCGVHFDDLPADHSHEEVDARWAALRNLTATPPQDPQKNIEE
ncbi:YceD family protein [Actinoplanes sp. NPDC020271]|uniref:YceD family protein n=1 Tax=Actinoplanes sp. NPDC020271 TaxID=3363896 RepID=UPI003788D93D